MVSPRLFVDAQVPNTHRCVDEQECEACHLTDGGELEKRDKENGQARTDERGPSSTTPDAFTNDPRELLLLGHVEPKVCISEKSRVDR